MFKKFSLAKPYLEKLVNKIAGVPNITLQTIKEKIDAICFNNDGSLLAVSVKGDIQIWDIEAKETIKIIKNDKDTIIRSLAFTSDNKFLLSGGDKHCVQLWDTNDWKCIRFCEPNLKKT